MSKPKQYTLRDSRILPNCQIMSNKDGVVLGYLKQKTELCRMYKANEWVEGEQVVYVGQVHNSDFKTEVRSYNPEKCAQLLYRIGEKQRRINERRSKRRAA